MLNITQTSFCQCQKQIALNNIEKGGEEGLSKWRSAPGRCDAVFRKLAVHLVFARIVVCFKAFSYKRAAVANASDSCDSETQ